MSEHFIGKVTLKAVIFKDGKFLLNRDVGDASYDLPGGRVDMGEVAEVGLAREMMEELGVTVVVGELFLFTKNSMGDKQSPTLFYCL